MIRGAAQSFKELRKLRETAWENPGKIDHHYDSEIYKVTFGTVQVCIHS